MANYNREGASSKNRSIMLRGTMLLASSLAALVAAGPAFAQEEAGASSGGLDEILVTARKRAESLQDTPIAISAFSGDSLEKQQINSVAGLDKVVPNLVVSETAPIGGSSAAASFFIRGIGQTDFNQNTEPGVGIYVDGVYIARSVGSALQLVDLEKIEVLRGPQGTLFGRNTIGGAISLTTKKPSSEAGGYATATVGSDLLLQFKGSVDAPITDKILTKVTFLAKSRNGYVTRVVDDKDLGNENKFAIRGDLRLLPTDNLTIDASVERMHERENGAPLTLISVYEDAPFAAYNNYVLNGAECGSMPSPASPNCYNSQWLSGRSKDNGTGRAVSDMDVLGTTLTINWDVPSPILGSDVAVKSISAYRKLDSYFAADHDHSPLVIDHTANDYKQRQYSQEVQVTGSSKRLNWAAGVYYFRETGTDANIVDFAVGSLLSGGSIRNRSLAFFGQATFNVTDKLSVTGGIRHTQENKRFTPNQYYITDFVADANTTLAAGSPQVLPGAVGRLKVNEENYLANISYKVTRDVMIYANYSDGFKSGGFTQRLAGPPFISPPSFRPEYVNVYEAGVKSELFDRRVRLNLAGFQTDYKDIQLNVLAPGLPNPFTLNAAKARIRGFEGELNARIAQNWDLNAAIGYLDAKYRSASGTLILDTVAGEIPVGTGLVNVNSSFVNAPKWTASAGVSYTAETDIGTIVPRIDWSYKSGVYLDALNTPQLHQSGYSLWNAAISYTDSSRLWTLSAGMKNVFDKRYLVAGYADVGASGFVEGVYNRGREWQLELRRSF